MYITEANLERLIDSKMRDCFGNDCSFYKIDEMWGAKVYRNKSTRNKAFARQQKCAEYGLAPDVGGTFNLSNKRFCYITELARVMTQEEAESYAPFMTSIDWAYDERSPMKEVVKEMQDEIEELTGWRNDDWCYFNVGWLYGELVLIDFGK